MLSVSGTRRLTCILALLISFSLFAFAQDIAVLTSLKGDVVIRNASGELRAVGKTKLLPGDEVLTSNNASAVIMYYTGKEIYLAANKKHVVAKEETESSFLKRLGSIFSNLLWSEKPSKTMLGAARGLGDLRKHVLRGIYPSHALLRDNTLTFEWIDTQRKQGRKYGLAVWDRSEYVRTSMTVRDTTRVSMKLESLGTVDDTLRWQVTEINAGFQSNEIPFFFLSDSEKDALAGDLQRIREAFGKDSTAFRRYLYESVLYIDLDLLMEAEASLIRLLQLQPDFVPAHEMLADVYAKIGKHDEALEEQKTIRSLFDNR